MSDMASRRACHARTLDRMVGYAILEAEDIDDDIEERFDPLDGKVSEEVFKKFLLTDVVLAYEPETAESE